MAEVIYKEVQFIVLVP